MATAPPAEAPPAPPPARVLLTNDDGPASPFFIAFAAALPARTGWATFTCPPSDGQSFVSKALSTGGGKSGGNHVSKAQAAAAPHAVSVRHVNERTAHVAGPPATCVNLALYHLAPDCDFVISGPNVGHNAGRGSLLSSGTVGAAMEGAVAGRKAVALSFPFFNGWGGWTEGELDAAVATSVDLIARLWADWAPGVDVYNLNVPLDHRGGAGGKGGSEKAGGTGGSGGGGGGSGAPTPSLPRRRVLLTTVDPGAQYASLYTRAEGVADGGDGDAPFSSTSAFAWGPSGLRVFESPDPAPGGDVAAIAAGHVSVSPLVAGFGAVVHAGAWEE